MSAADLLRKSMEDSEVPGIPSAASTYGVRPPAGIPRRAVQQEIVERVVEIVPSNAMLLNADGTIAMGNFLLTGNGLIVGEAATFEEWQSVGGVLLRIESSIQWLIGDWINQGERVYGQTYKTIAAATNRDEKTLRNYVYVASHVELSLRRDDLTFGHHALVASIDDREQQGDWLEQAAAGEWSIAKMRQTMAGDSPDGQDAPIVANAKTALMKSLKMLKKASQEDRETAAQIHEDAARRLRKGR